MGKYTSVSTREASEDGSFDGFHGGFRQSMSWLHTWIGLTLSVVLYFMFVTGTTGYVQSQITRWMTPELGKQTAASTLAHSTEDMARAAVGHALNENAEWKTLYTGWPVKGSVYQDFYAYAEGHAPAEEGVEAKSLDVKFDAKTLSLKDGASGVRETGGGTALYSMHYNLHYMPENPIKIGGYEIAWATFIVGSATMFMLIAIITGVVVHKKIFADFFTFRPGKGQRSWLDAHNLSSVMALPFMVVITYSGLLFYTYEYMPSVKAVTYGYGEKAQELFDRDVYPHYSMGKIERSGTAAPIADVGIMIAKAREAWGGREPQWIDLFNTGDGNARAVVWASGTTGALTTEMWPTLLFDATTGEMLTKPEVSANPAVTVADVLIAIHEGNYAGWGLRWLYLLTGSFGAAMIATGLVLWTTKRKQKLKEGERADLGIEFVDRTNVGIIAGLLIAIAAYFWANRLLPVGIENRGAWEVHVLFITWGVMLLHSVLRPSAKAWGEQFAVAALAFGLLPVLNAMTTDVHLGETLFVTRSEMDLELASFDLVALGLGLIFARLAWKRYTRPATVKVAKQAKPVATTLVAEPAE